MSKVLCTADWHIHGFRDNSHNEDGTPKKLHEMLSVILQMCRHAQANNIHDILVLGDINDKKNIIDKLFGFSIINDMRETVKQDRKYLREEIKTLEDELNIITESITSINSKLNELERQKQIKLKRLGCY